MLIDRETAVKRGYSPIVSDKQAYNFLRREIKSQHKRSQRANRPGVFDYADLMKIKKGNWFQFFRLSSGRCYLCVIEVKD